MTFNRSGLGNLYKRESDPNVKERLLLVLKVEVDGKIPSQLMLQRSYIEVEPGLQTGLQGMIKKESTD